MTIIFNNAGLDYQHQARGAMVSGSRLNIVSRTVTPAAANSPYGALGIYPGQPVFQSATNDRHCSPNPAAGAFIGIALSDDGMVQSPDYIAAGQPPYSPGDEISILKVGVVVVGCASNVASGDQAYVGPYSGTASSLAGGALTNSPTGNVKISATWASTTLIGGDARLRVF